MNVFPLVNELLARFTTKRTDCGSYISAEINGFPFISAYPPAGEGRCTLLLAGRVHVNHCKVLRDLLHVLIVEQGVEARLV